MTEDGGVRTAGVGLAVGACDDLDICVIVGLAEVTGAVSVVGILIGVVQGVTDDGCEGVADAGLEGVTDTWHDDSGCRQSRC
jgi:hypothetical protein